MTEIIKEIILHNNPEAVIDETGQWFTINIEGDKWLPLANELKLNHELLFDYLFCVTCVDWKTHLSMVYHLSSSVNNNIIVIKANISDRVNASIESVCSLWKTAEFHEREAYDLFGVKFKNHPDLRRLFLTDEWEGWPLRKDYEDPINMIKL